MANYNVYVEYMLGVYNLLDLTEDDLEKVIEAYDLGKDSFFIAGENFWFKELSIIKIIKIRDYIIATDEYFKDLPSGHDKTIHDPATGKIWYKLKALQETGNDVTKNYLKSDFGWKKKVKSDDILMLKRHYVHTDRLEELKELKSSNHDFKKLIRICEEINICYSLECIYAVGTLLRSLLDHISPIFGFSTFKEVVNNYNGSRSFKESMETLEKSLRKISDSFLHTPIRSSEVLPNSNQVDFVAPIDQLLAEIIRIKT